MKDFKENELNVGDKVVVYHPGGGFNSSKITGQMCLGTITRFTPMKCNVQYTRKYNNGEMYDTDGLFLPIQLFKLA